jgi:hypothetical protein
VVCIAAVITLGQNASTTFANVAKQIGSTSS